jgi:inosose dehydratase
MLIGCGQVSWQGVEEKQVLREVAEAGYDGAPPRLEPPRPAAEVLTCYQSHGLRPAPCYFNAPLWERHRRAAIVAAARRAARFMREVGCTVMYVAAGGAYQAASGMTRLEAAAKVGPDDGLTDSEFQALAETLNALGEASLEEGVRSCFHPHVGQVIESEPEIERLLAATDPALVFLGPDTGHLAWAGVEPVAFCQRHVDRIRTLHLKDIDEGVRRRGSAAGWDYRTFAGNGIFTELGDGCVDFPRLLSVLDEARFDGWLIVETDVPRAPTAFESAARSRRYLRSLGV